MHRDGRSADASFAADPDAFFAALDINAAVVTAGHNDQENMVGLGKTFAQEVNVIATIVEATTAAGTIETCIMYVVD
jgi:hypothetical protein